jgi:hypothetical protein
MTQNLVDYLKLINKSTLGQRRRESSLSKHLPSLLNSIKHGLPYIKIMFEELFQVSLN